MDQNFLKAIRKLFSMVSPNSSPTRVLASVTAEAVVHLASRYLSAALGVPHEQKGLIGLFLQLDRVPYRRGPPTGSGRLPPRQAPTTLRPLVLSAASIEARNRVHLISMFPASPGTRAKFCRWWGIEILFDRGFWQAFPGNPHNTFASAMSDQHLPPPSKSTQHRVVIG